MPKFILLFLVIAVSVFQVNSQTESIDLSKIKVEPTPTPKTIEDFDLEELEIIISNRFPLKSATGKVIGVHDGDTIKLLDKDNNQYNVRFNGIDAPELKQDFGNRSHKSLSELAFGKIATIEYDKIDKYGRFVCKVIIDGIDINLEQVKRGMAWHYKKYQDEQSAEDRKAYSEAEINARNLKLGLWSQPNPTEPSAWRRGENNPNLDGVPKGSILGNSNSMVYHTPGCSSYAKVAPQNRVIFKTEQEAIKKGYRLSGQCQSTLPIEERPKKAVDNSTKTYFTGSRGGCYYLSPSGKKNYVDKSFCN